MNYTSIKQSKKLLELGLNLESADMYWAVDANIAVASPYITKTDYETQIPAYKGAIPCWSVGALLSVVPEKVLDYYFTFEKSGGIYHIFYREEKYNYYLSYFSGDCLIDVVYSMVVWILENVYIKKGE